MLDNELISLVIETINPQLLAAGIPNSKIMQGYQPTQEGVLTDGGIYIHKLGDSRIGYPKVTNVYDPKTDTEVETESVAYMTMFQISAWNVQDPNNTTQWTASDILNRVAYTLQSADCVANLAASGVGVLSVGQIANPYFRDDRDRWEASPNFTVTFTHYQTISTTSNYATTTTLNILPVQ